MLLYQTFYPAFESKVANVSYFLLWFAALYLDITLILANGRDFVDISTLELNQRQYDDDFELATFDKTV